MNKNYGKRWQELCEVVQKARNINGIGCIFTIRGKHVDVFACLTDGDENSSRNGVFPITPKGLREAKEFAQKSMTELSALHEPEPSLNKEGEKQRFYWQTLYGGSDGCRCAVMVPPCGNCVHPGNPKNQAETPEHWVGGVIGDCETW